MGTLSGIVDAETPDGTGAVIGPAAGAPMPTGPVAVPEASGDPETPVTTGGSGFADFYAGHYADLVRLATLLSGSADSAPDLVQDCFVRLHGRWSAVREPLPYVRRSVVHACASHHRSIARARRQLPPEAVDSVLGADELGDALAKLPARQRAAVVLRYYGDLPDADIARAARSAR
jgi:DNA-directed RNA polymerase specialized sigma24 family protein